jgi:glycosyltransferase involved in cell wall biosynthesis
MSEKYPRVVIAGYSPEMQGGVANVTRVFLDHYPDSELHPVLHRYHPKGRAALEFVASVWSLAVRLFARKPPQILMVIVGSSGDALRSILLILLGRLRGVRVCCQYHKSADKVVPRPERPLLRRLVVGAFGLAHEHWALSPRLRDGIRPFLPESSEPVVIPNAIDDEWFEEDPPPLEERTGSLAFFGRWSLEKGVDDLVAVMAEMPPHITCDIYCHGAPAGRHPNCRLHPWESADRVRQVMRQSRLVVLPSRAEAYPTVLLEALACGTPVVASDVGGVADIVESSGAGRVFQTGDRKAMRDHILDVLDDDEKWRRMSRDGHQWVQMHRVENIRRRWFQFFGRAAT